MPTILPSAALAGTAPVAPIAPAAPLLKQPDTVRSDAPALSQEATQPLEATQDSLSPKFAALVRKEKAIRMRQKEIEAQSQALEQSRTDFEQAQAWKAKLSQDPLSVLQEAGISYDQLTEAILNQGNPESHQFEKLQREIQSLKQKQEEAANQFQQSKAEQYEQAKTQIKNEVSLLVDGDESFEAIRANGELAKEAVVELIEHTFQEEGYLMSIEDAVKSVEEYLFDQALEMARLKKVQSKLNPTPSTPTEGEPVSAPLVQKPQPSQQPQLNTLSNRIAPSTLKPLSPRERRERAILAFQGKL